MVRDLFPRAVSRMLLFEPFVITFPNLLWVEVMVDLMYVLLLWNTSVSLFLYIFSAP